jgi:sterol desaturase/sphingolipid hydroxylase (fatty acid hydroxylase superfamily)
MSELSDTRNASPERFNHAPPSPVGVRHLPWVSAAFIGGVFLVVGLCALVPSLVWDADGTLALDADWVDGLQDFYLMVLQTASFQILAAMLAAGSVLEMLLPARRSERSAARLNVPFGALMVLLAGAITLLPLYIADVILEYTGWRNVFALDFPADESVLLSAAAMLLTALIADFFFYWFHRLQHASRWLWQEHLVHHSDMALNVTTAQRAHFLEHILTPLAIAVPMTVLFNLPMPGVAAIAVLPSIWSYVVHMNVRVGFGPLWWLLSSPQYHRIHHSLDPAHHHRNFALWFPVWDVLFGTAHVPRDGEFPATGVAGIEIATLRDAFTFPFVRWAAMAAAAMRRHRSAGHG